MLFLAIEQSAMNGITFHNKKHRCCHAFGIFPAARKVLLVLVCAVSGEDTFGLTPLGGLPAKPISVIIERPCGRGNSN